MFTSFKSAALAATLALGAFAATPASADGLHIGFGKGDVRVGVTLGDVHPAGYGYGYHRRGCSPWRAVDKARDMGIRRARVVDAGYRGVVVRGHRWGERVRVVFGNAPHCPVRSIY